MSEITLRVSSTATLTSVASSASSVQLLAANALRRGASVQNTSTSILYVFLGAGPATATLHSVQMAPNSYFEVPYSHTGPIQGIWASVNGQAIVTEYT